MPATVFTITYPAPSLTEWDNPEHYERSKARIRIKNLIHAGKIDAALTLAEQTQQVVEESAPLFVAAVLGSQEREARKSDYSDFYTTYNVWTGSEVKEVTAQYPVPETDRYVEGTDHHVEWVIDADAETTGRYAEQIAAWRAFSARVATLYTEARKMINTIEEGAKHLQPVVRDADVSVVKGRKVPKGRGYRVTHLGSGQFGDFAHLRAADGREYKFVSLVNLEREVTNRETDHYTGALTAHLGDPTLVGIAKTIIAGTVDGWGVLADRIEELRGGEFGEIFRKQVARYVG